MGMCLQMRRCRIAMIADLRAADGFGDFVAPEDFDAVPDGELIDLDKAWHALHFLLAGDPAEAPLPGGALFAGEQVGEDFGLGPARLLSAPEVKAFADFLSMKPDDFVEQTLDFAALEAADIYPEIWDRREREDIDYVAGYFRDLKSFMQSAAKAGDAVVVVLM
jgi:hypothetical protein